MSRLARVVLTINAFAVGLMPLTGWAVWISKQPVARDGHGFATGDPYFFACLVLWAVAGVLWAMAWTAVAIGISGDRE